MFWKIHDPTTLNRQGPDIGTQYRSAIYTHSPEQAEQAAASRDNKQNSGTVRNTIVTEIAPHKEFFKAEEYHQKYFEKQGHH